MCNNKCDLAFQVYYIDFKRLQNLSNCNWCFCSFCFIVDVLLKMLIKMYKGKKSSFKTEKKGSGTRLALDSC